MADVPSALKDWSATASSNSPTDATTIGAGLADNLQALQAVVRGDLASKGSDIASSANPDVAAVQGLYHDLTGANTVTGLGTGSAGIWKILHFDSTPQLTHSTALALPGAANITAAADDVGIFYCEAASIWRCISYFRAASGALLNITGLTAETSVSNSDEVALYDASAGTVDKATIANISRGSVLLASTSIAAASATVDFASNIDSTYDEYELHVHNALPATDNVSAWLRTSSDAGSSYASTGAAYSYVLIGRDSGGTDRSGNNNSSTAIVSAAFVSSTTSRGGVSEVVKFCKPSNTVHRKHFLWSATNAQSATEEVAFSGSGHRLDVSAINAIRFMFSSGDVQSGDFYLFGVKKS